MTAPAVAPASGPIAPAAPRPVPQGAADPFAFEAMLDSLPGASSKADAPATEEKPDPSNELARHESSRGETAHHSLLNDSALLAALPFALRSASMIDENPQAANSSHSSTLPAMKGPKSDASGVSPAAGAKAATVGRLVGERAFHFGPSTFTGAISSRTLAVNMPFASAVASAGNPTSQADLSGESALAANFSSAEAVRTPPPPEAVSTIANPKAAAPIAPRAGAPSNRANITRAAAHESGSSGQKPTVSAPPPVARVATSTAGHAPAESSGGAADGRTPDPTTFAAPLTLQTDQFGAQLSEPFAAGTSFQLDGMQGRRPAFG